MDLQSHYPVVIVGAGPVGVVTATLLAQYGVESLILDRWPDLYPQPRAVHLDHEVYRILDRLGIGSEFAAISRPGLGLRLLNPDLTVLAEFRRDPEQTQHGHPEANMFDQPELEALLRTNLKHHPQATLRGNAEVTDVTTLPCGRSLVTFTDRGEDGVQTVECDYLLGCDGANSLVRRHIGATMRDLRFKQRWLVIDVDAGVDLRQWGGVHQVCSPRRAGTFMQISETRYRWEFRMLPGEAASDFGTPETLRPLIAPWLRSAPEADLRIIRVAEYTFRAQVADRWRRGNTLLLGDAAHLTPPFIGQGLCAGLRDAMNLSWKLAGVVRGSLPADALDSYQAERKPHVRTMIARALTMGYWMTAGGRTGDTLRRLIVPRMNLMPGFAAKVLAPETPRLHSSALIGRHTAARDLAGKLCPNVVTANGERLDSTLGQGFSVITRVAPTDHERALIESRHAVVQHAAPGTPTANWLAESGVTAAIVRPDFTVMAAGGDLTALCAALPDFTLARRPRPEGV
jgi:3-(3-hydroxy-phenyl)propionate hydroxylase